jgi:hypothetical protein
MIKNEESSSFDLDSSTSTLINAAIDAPMNVVASQSPVRVLLSSNRFYETLSSQSLSSAELIS